MNLEQKLAELKKRDSAAEEAGGKERRERQLEAICGRLSPQPKS